MVELVVSTTTAAIIGKSRGRDIPSEKGVNRGGKGQKHVIAQTLRECPDTQREKILEHSLSYLHPYVSEDYVDKNMEKSPTPFHCYQRDRKPTKIFSFEKNHGYHAANRIMNTIITGVLNMGGVLYYQYIHVLIVNQDNILSNSLLYCHFTFKAGKKMTQTLQ